MKSHHPIAPAGLFDPVGHASVADAVVEQIEKMIVQGILKEGCKLPPEREMSEVLQVSRPKLRQALKQLEQAGLIRVHHGEGAYIAKLVGSAMTTALLELYTRHGEAFYDYLEYRQEQEAFAARLAAQRATQPDRERIQQLLHEMTKAWEAGDEEAAAEADFGFHKAVVDASQNITLIHMMGSIYELTRRGLFYNRDFLRTIDGSGETLLAQHHAIGQAILDADPVQAELASRNHLKFVEQSFRRGQEQQMREAQAEKRRQLSS